MRRFILYDGVFVDDEVFNIYVGLTGCCILSMADVDVQLDSQVQENFLRNRSPPCCG